MTGTQAFEGRMSGTGGAEGVEVPEGANEGRKQPLTVFPKHQTADDVYYIGGAWAPASITARDKRFTDAELAAEYHAMGSQCRREQWIEAVRGDDYTESEAAGQVRMYGRLNRIHRFATLPHYDEVDQ